MVYFKQKRGNRIRNSLLKGLILIIAVAMVGGMNVLAQRSSLDSYGETVSSSDTLNCFVTPVTPTSTVPDGYIGVYTLEDLDNVRNDLSADYILMNDLDFSASDFEPGGQFYNEGRGWIPIGQSGTEVADFIGNFNGNGHVISGLRITPDDAGQLSCVGLFFGLDFTFDNGVANSIRNLGIEDVYISSNARYVGAIVGENWSHINNCYFDGTIYASSKSNTGYVGGIAGLSDSALSDCNSSGYLNVHNAYAGGIAGSTDESFPTFQNCHSESVIDGVNSTLGGILGDSIGYHIIGCSNTGNISASGSVGTAGGIAGGGVDVSVKSSYNSGKIQVNTDQTAKAGGIVGSGNNALIKDCFNTGKIIALSDGVSHSYAYAGGILASGSTEEGGIYYCYDTGAVLATAADVCSKGPILGKATYGRYLVENSYYWKGIAANGIGIPCKEAALQLQKTYIGFNFSTTWKMDTDLKRPVLRNNEPTAYPIQYNLNGGTLPSTAKYYYMTGSNLLLPTAIKTGAAFYGWTIVASPGDGDMKYQYIPDGTIGSLNYYAQYGPPIESVTSIGYDSLKVLWKSVGNATSYKIYRATSATGSYALVKTVAAPDLTWIDLGRTTGKNYYYKVSAVAGGKTYSYNTYKYDKAIPSTPSISVTESTASSVKITWSGAPGATAYQVYQATSPTSSTFNLVHTGSSTSRSWTNTGLAGGKTYYYKIRVYHLEGTSKIYSLYSKTKLVSL